jgi:hypothetical protein
LRMAARPSGLKVVLTPFRDAENFARCAVDHFFPVLAAAILARVSSLRAPRFLPVRTADSFARVSSLTIRPVKAALILRRASSETGRPGCPFRTTDDRARLHCRLQHFCLRSIVRNEPPHWGHDRVNWVRIPTSNRFATVRGVTSTAGPLHLTVPELYQVGAHVSRGRATTRVRHPQQKVSTVAICWQGTCPQAASWDPSIYIHT